MAILDSFNEFSDSQTGLTTTDVSTNTIDTNAANDVGVGNSLQVEFTIDTNFGGGTSIRFDIVADTVAALSSPTVINSSAVYATAVLLAGRDPIRVPIPGGVIAEQFLGIQYTIVGTMNAGAVSAYIVQGEQASQGNLIDHGAN